MRPIIEGVENKEVAVGPRWVIPISGVVVTATSDEIPGIKPSLTNGFLLGLPKFITAARIADQLDHIPVRIFEVEVVVQVFLVSLGTL